MQTIEIIFKEESKDIPKVVTFDSVQNFTINNGVLTVIFKDTTYFYPLGTLARIKHIK